MVDNQASQSLLCPTCRLGLVMSERQGIEIDYCPQCRGVWLDRGELDKIIERTTADNNARPSSDGRAGMFDDSSHGEHGKKHGYERSAHGRRKGFLRELFD